MDAGITSNLIKRIWKIDLIEEENQDWKDLYDEIIK
ncbi:GIY-YIG nuclease family protein [Wolbachia endosymbiont of Folsomia candida]|nr:nuclease [Wolbachia endosymbiont of Folsomia candida]